MITAGNSENIRAILFDFGGVLVDWDGTTPLVQLTQGRFSAEAARLFWFNSPSVRKLEIGQCTIEEFARGAVRELKLELEPTEFIRQFSSWDKGALPGAIELLEELKPRFTLACLSNNNEIHWRNPELQRLLPYFRHCYVSFEMGLMKPDPASFELAIRGIGLPPGQVLFLDDNPECVHAAQACGLSAIQAKGVEGARAALRQAGIEPGTSQ